MRTKPAIGQRVRAMKKCPKIGERVLAWYDRGEQIGSIQSTPRSCVGRVTAIYKRFDDEFDDDTGDLIRRGPLLPESEWKVAVMYEGEKPAWWPYPGDTFVPAVKDCDPV